MPGFKRNSYASFVVHDMTHAISLLSYLSFDAFVSSFELTRKIIVMQNNVGCQLNHLLFSKSRTIGGEKYESRSTRKFK